MPPSLLLGLTSGSYEAYCLDEAVWYFGTIVENELEKAGQPKKKSKGVAEAEAARKRLLAKYFDNGDKKSLPNQGFADPAALFGTS